ncbi:MAG: SsrA-binding protein SmpB [Ignavibacteriales bacterium]
MSGVKVIAENRKAWHDYHIEETIEAGIALVGTEVKSLRLGKLSLRDSYAQVKNGEAFLYNAHISPYDPADRFNHDPLRPRRLLLHKREIQRILQKAEERGYTLVPLKMYFKRGLAKVELAVARGKREYDKRQDIAEKDARRDIARALKKRMD